MRRRPRLPEENSDFPRGQKVFIFMPFRLLLQDGSKGFQTKANGEAK